MKSIKKSKTLKQIISEKTLAENNISSTAKKLSVTDVCDDSRKVVEGSLFVAVNGNAVDGRKYIKDAIENGAKYIVYDASSNSTTSSVFNKDNQEKYKNVIFIASKNVRHELAYITSHFFDYSLDDIVAVTGTNGKSSTVDIVRQIWSQAGRQAASIGTLGLIFGDGTKKKLSGTLTSPGTIELHKIFSSLKSDSSNTKTFSIALEASSHGINQNRLDCIPFSVCAFTNFTQDHLDYHKTMENYWLAKERLFRELAEASKTKFVVNADDPRSKKIKEIAKEKNIQCIDYGFKAQNVRILNIKARSDHQLVSVSFLGKEIAFALPLFGRFQVYNSLCAASICYLTGIKIEDAVKFLENIQPINGRLELAAKFNGAKIYVDYAHTPDALKNAILSLREHNPKRIITVFGCGGERDKQKRSVMGKIAEEFSDVVIVTDDNPRNESAEQIRKMILKGCRTAIEFGQRQKAIERTIEMLQDGDFLLIAGKGHENYQIIGKEIIHFSDKEVILNKVSQ